MYPTSTRSQNTTESASPPLSCILRCASMSAECPLSVPCERMRELMLAEVTREGVLTKEGRLDDLMAAVFEGCHHCTTDLVGVVDGAIDGTLGI